MRFGSSSRETIIFATSSEHSFLKAVGKIFQTFFSLFPILTLFLLKGKEKKKSRYSSIIACNVVNFFLIADGSCSSSDDNNFHLSYSGQILLSYI